MLASEQELMTKAVEESERAKASAFAKENGFDALGQHIVSLLKKRINNRAAKQEEWTECGYLYFGNMYGNSYLGENPFFDQKQRRRRPDFNIVRTKCDAAISQCIDMQFAIGEKNWDLWPAANSLDPSDSVKCALMSDEIETQLEETRYGFQARKAIFDRVVFGAGILKGPVNTGKLTNKYERDPATGVWVSRPSVIYKPMIERVDPWMFFPDDTVNDADKISDAIQVHPMSPYELAAYKDHEGYDASTIEEILKTPPLAYATEYFLEYTKLADANPRLFKDKYCVIEYHGPITKKLLDAADIEPIYESPTEDYFGEVWVCNGKVIRIELENIEGSFETPYAISQWRKDPSSVFGFGHPLSMRDQQRVVTQTWRMVLDNASLSSGPQAALQNRFIQPADGEWEMAPRKVWYLTDPMMKVGDAIQFFETPNVTQDLLPVLNLARQFSEEESGTPAIAAGLQSTQMGNSATGDMIAAKASTTILDALSEEWDDQVTQKIIRRMYAWNMQYSPREEIKGNYVIDVRSSNEYKNKQMNIRDIERLSMESAQNPNLAKWLNQDALTQTRLAMMSLPSRNIIRTEEEAAAWEQQQAQQAAQSDPNAIKAQIEMAKLEVAKQKLQMEGQVAAMELQMDQMRVQIEARMAEMKEQVALANNQAMAMAAQASTLKAQLDYEAKMAKLEVDAQKSGTTAALDATKFDADLAIKAAAQQQDIIIKNREMDLFEEELKVKREKGTGI